jgi:signal peptidase II
MLARGLALAALAAIVDQLSKIWVLQIFADRPLDGRVIEVAPFFNLVLTWNRGMSFGLFNTNGSLNTAIFTVLATVIVIGLALWLRRVEKPLLAAAVGLVIGGAVGNVVDRLWRGAVVDFLDFHWAGWHFYVFNVADAAISVGVGLMLLDGVLVRRANA